MSEWSKLQSSVSNALEDLNLEVPSGIKRLKNGVVPKKRFSVYRNNVTLSLISVLASTYPVVEEIVGDEFFATMAREFALSHLPQSPVMINYGEEFPDFLKTFVPVKELPYLSDIARLEWHRNTVYHGANASSVTIEALGEYKEEDVPNLSFELHPTFALVKSDYPIVTIWQAHQQDNPPEFLKGVTMEQGEAALIIRPELDVLINQVSIGTYEFLQSLNKGLSFSLSVEQAIAIEPSFDIPANLAGLFNLGAVTGVNLTTTS